MPRPSSFTQETADIICERIAEGESLRDICACDDMPCRTTVLKWLANVPLFAAQYACAREAQGDVMDDMIMAEALACDNDNVQAARVRIDAFKWRAGKLRPKVYGDKLGIGQADGLEPVKMGVSVQFVDPATK